MRIADEVWSALARGAGVVALESTVIAHGLPRPRNVQVALELEEIVRQGGGVPATIAVLDGEPVIGLSQSELGRIAADDNVLKLSTRELALAAARKQTGATTVAATSFLARLAGIQVFATGGIGGVHRGVPLDVSADLPELQRTEIIVVCAGAKSILDLPATREMLETLCIPVLGWRTDSFPGFYIRDSGLRVDARIQGAGEVAELWGMKRKLQVPGGLLVCAPIPAEHALDAAAIEDSIAAALRAAEEQGVRGKKITPFLLKNLSENTAGGSLEANVALLRNNTTVATEIAVALAGGG